MIDTGERAYTAAILDLRGRIEINRVLLKGGRVSYTFFISVKSCHREMLDDLCKTWGGKVIKDGNTFKLFLGTQASVYVLSCCTGFFKVKSYEAELTLRFYEAFRFGDLVGRETLYKEFEELKSGKRELTMTDEKI
jgi:hypothetical protein